MKRAILFSSILFGFLAARSQAVDDAGAASRDLEGTWLPLSAEFAGENYPDQILKTMKLTLKDKNYTVTVGDQIDEGTWKIDPKKSPRALDITGTNGPNKGKTILTIYDLEKDTLRVCYDLGGKQRPTEFKTKANTKLFLVTYKRAKP
jgi:uncharacterized protein (TIGR03067 family)